ncbi:MAG: hypothetical protein PHP44_10780 [Kiritimatiellae bacterium]|nr:hypothetical protein [Kiritimatiellia bacterium]MDD4736573.1 hypothetical protein [Kiritimatiellia bacterium]
MMKNDGSLCQMALSARWQRVGVKMPNISEKWAKNSRKRTEKERYLLTMPGKPQVGRTVTVSRRNYAAQPEASPYRARCAP